MSLLGVVPGLKELSCPRFYPFPKHSSYPVTFDARGQRPRLLASIQDNVEDSFSSRSPCRIDGGLCHTCVAVQFLSLLSLAFFTAIPIIPKADPEIPSNKLPACKSLLQSLFLGGPVSESKSKILIMIYL